MNSVDVRELLDRAAAGVTPVETDPVGRLVGLGRRSMRRRRRAWGTAGLVAIAAVVAAVVALPQAMATPERSAAAESTVSFGGLSVVVPPGWRTSRVESFDQCNADPHTVYLAGRWYNSSPLTSPPGSPPYSCKSEGQAWMVLVDRGVSLSVNPGQLVIKDDQLLQVEQGTKPSGWTYRAFNQEASATGVLISGSAQDREQLLKRVSWPAGPPAPPSGGLALPDRITEAVTEDAGPMVSATDAKTLTRIRTKLAQLRDPVPADESCTLQKPGRVGISLGDVIVVLGDAKCPQAISTGGGRVRAPAGLGKELLALIVASDHAAARHAMN